ncbi:ATP-binding protein [Bacteroidota bacterium]
MLFYQFAIGYSIINLTIASILLYKLRKSVVSLFYFLCVLFLITFAFTGYILTTVEIPFILEILSSIIIFIYSMFPFLFLHYMVIFIGYVKIGRRKKIIYAIYSTGIFIYTMVLLNFIPTPISVERGMSINAYIYFITWMSILFSLGIAQIYSLAGGLTHAGIKSKLLFTGFIILFLILPGPFAEAILSKLLVETSLWYYVFSIAALIIAVFAVFRYRTAITLYDSIKSVLSIMTDIIIKTDEFLRIQIIKGAVTTVLGYKENELIGKSINDIIVDDDYMVAYRNFTRAKKMKEGFFDVDFVHKNGKKIPMNISLSPILENNIIMGYVGIGRDISLRKEYEIQMLKAKNEAEKSDRLKTEFLRQMSHEVRTPINGIFGAIEILKDEMAGKIKGVIKDAFVMIDESGNRIMQTINDILEMSQLQTSNYRVNKININLEKEILTSLIHSYQSAAGKKSLNLSYENNAASNRVFGDIEMIRQIFAGLIENAIKYTDEGSVKVIQYNNSDNKICVDVIDTGIGISPEYLTSLFTPFSQEDTGDSRSYEGCGLKLALIKQYCSINNAEITVKSEKGSGSKFTVIFDEHKT